MEIALALHRLQFALTVSFHYVFPQITMGLAPFLVLWRTLAHRRGDALAAEAARFWGRIFGIAFAFGVVTGMPMEFQFATNWSRFVAGSGSVIGQTLAMEGVLAFFVESTFVGLMLYGEGRIAPRLQWLATIATAAGAWISAYFIVATNAWMQHPVGHVVGPDGAIRLGSLAALLANPWILWQLLHTLAGAVVTGSFAVASVGAYWILAGRNQIHARLCLRTAVPAALAALLLMLFVTGDRQAVMIARHQPATLAAMEGLFETRRGAPLVLFGRPNVAAGRLDHAVTLPKGLSLLAFGDPDAEVKGLDAFPPKDRPDLIPLLFYSFHGMVWIGILLALLTGVSTFLLRRGLLERSRPALWALALAFPLPIVANTLGWAAAEVGRQPWLVYGLVRTSEGSSTGVPVEHVAFSTGGFAAIYLLLAVFFVLLVGREVRRGHGAEGVH